MQKSKRELTERDGPEFRPVLCVQFGWLINAAHEQSERSIASPAEHDYECRLSENIRIRIHDERDVNGFLALRQHIYMRSVLDAGLSNIAFGTAVPLALGKMP